jgi:hypothetical protein
MASIVIKDLPENIELDRQAMSAITGGARLRGRQTSGGRMNFRTDRMFSFPGSRSAMTGSKGTLGGTTPRK